MVHGLEFWFQIHMHYINIKRDDFVFQNIAFYKQFYDDIVKSAFSKLTRFTW